VKILIAPDKFKGSLSANQFCEIAKSALLDNHPRFHVTTIPIADGGEGTCQLLTQLSRGEHVSVKVFDPLMREIESGYGISGNTAFIEMALASGLELLKPTERNCSITSTYGTGQLIKHALDAGISNIVLGIGGSATNDAGTGMAKALGYRLLSITGSDLEGIGANLIHLDQIDSTASHSGIKKTHFTTLCDVTNPLHGQNGAAYVFAKQKGATDEEIKLLDKGLKHFEKLALQMGCDLRFRGAGAAGGLGAGTKLFLNATIQRGIDFIIDFTRLETKIQESDLVITGEGKLDKQTLSGKAVSGVAALAKKHGKHLIVVCGACYLSVEQTKAMGISQVIVLQEDAQSKMQAMLNAADALKNKIAQLKLG